MRPASLPSADRYPHGTRGRYVAGKCRCDSCRAANAAYYHVRKQRGIEAAAELAPLPAGPVERTYRTRGGAVRLRTYKRSCAGVNGKPCPGGRFLRNDSKGGVCGGCRDRLSFNGLVDATPARKHLRALSRKGVGSRAVADAASVARSVVAKIRSGDRTEIKASTAKAILAITTDARADGSLVPAAPTLRRIEKMIEAGWTKVAIARAIGRSIPILQSRRSAITAANELAVRRLFNRRDEVPQGGGESPCRCAKPVLLRDVCAKCERPLAETQPKARAA